MTNKIDLYTYGIALNVLIFAYYRIHLDRNTFIWEDAFFHLTVWTGTLFLINIAKYLKDE